MVAEASGQLPSLFIHQSDPERFQSSYQGVPRDTDEAVSYTHLTLPTNREV